MAWNFSSRFREILLRVPYMRTIQIIFNKSAREKLERIMDQSKKEGISIWNRSAQKEWLQEHRADIKQALKTSGIDLVRHVKGCKCKEKNKHA